MRATTYPLVLGIALAATLGVAPALAAGPSSADRAFVAAAGVSNASEIAFGKEAIENGDVATQTFARLMVRDHARLGNALSKATTPLGLKVYRTPSVRQARAIGRTVKLHGAAFDRSYRTQQVTAHQATLVIFRKEVAHGSEATLKQAARAAIPTIEMHLKMARHLAAEDAG